METVSWTASLAGGALIGLASGALMLWLGRIAGVSGLLNGALEPARVEPGERGWRLAFVAGLVMTGFALAWAVPPAAPALSTLPPGPRAAWMVAAGLLVGFGTRMGSGCTSGHGVCGLARLSVRSLAAVATFLGTGIAATWVLRHWGG